LIASKALSIASRSPFNAACAASHSFHAGSLLLKSMSHSSLYYGP
jgi:hypothetical protein